MATSGASSCCASGLWTGDLRSAADAGARGRRFHSPQQLFELGENQNLPGYGYKEFAGNEAMVIRGLAMYPLPTLARRRFALGGLCFLESRQCSRSALSPAGPRRRTRAARSSIVGSGHPETQSSVRRSAAQVYRCHGRLTASRSSIDFRLRFFGGAVSIGVARATDRHQAWRLVRGTRAGALTLSRPTCPRSVMVSWFRTRR